MKNELISYRTCTCNINYHVVWSVKHSRKIIDAEIEQFLHDTAMDVAADKGFTLHLFEAIDMDHVHCFVSAQPKLSITDIVKYLKGITGRKLLEKYPELRQELSKGELWNHSYYVETIGSVSEEDIKQFLKKQATCY